MIFGTGGVNVGMILWRVHQKIESGGNYLVSPHLKIHLVSFFLSLLLL